MSNYPGGVTNSMIERQCLAADEVQCVNCHRIMDLNGDVWQEYEGVGVLCNSCGDDYEDAASEPEEGR
jgi:hypothetical protein